MPSSEETKVLQDIKYNIHLGKEFIAGMTADDFRKDIKTFYATTRAMEIVSEASRRLLPATKAKASHLPWADIAGAGNVYRHDYELLETEIMWMTATHFVDPLLAFVEAEIESRRL